MASPNLISIGYEGRDADELIAQLKAERVTVLVDVRLNPISRKKGLSKTALKDALNASGIGYLHYRELGNPKDNRDAYREGAREARDRFERLLNEPTATEALRHVMELLDDERVALLCFERDHSTCHRSQISSALQGLDPSLLVHKV